MNLQTSQSSVFLWAISDLASLLLTRRVESTLDLALVHIFHCRELALEIIAGTLAALHKALHGCKLC